MNPIPHVGAQVDAGKFGTVVYWTGEDLFSLETHEVQPAINQNGKRFYEPVYAEEQGGYHIGVEWDEPHEFQKVIVRYCHVDGLPKPEDVRLQYWRHTWPAAPAGGWTAIDDPYNGEWVTIHSDTKAEGSTWTYTFDPLDLNEIWGNNHRELRDKDLGIFTGVSYRKALKARLLFGKAKPQISDIKILSHSTWKKAIVWIEFGCGIERAQAWDGKLEVYGGHLIALESPENQADITSPDSWKFKAEAESKVIRADALYANWLEGSTDRTIVSVHTDSVRFSFLVSDALKEPVYIKDMGVFISVGEKRADFATFVKRSGKKPACVYDKILLEPEQTFERATNEIPHLVKTKHNAHGGRYIILGCDSNRQEFALQYNGHIFVDKVEMKPKDRDLARILYPGKYIHYKFATGNPPDFREREDDTTQSLLKGHLPVVTTEWEDRGIAFVQESFVALLEESPWNEAEKRGDEPTVLLMRFTIRNVTDESKEAQLFFIVEPTEILEYKDGFVFAKGKIVSESIRGAAVEKQWISYPYEKPRLRAYLDTYRRGAVSPQPCTYSPDNISVLNNSLAYSLALKPLEVHTIEFRIPFVTFTEDKEIETVRGINYEAKRKEIIDYWEDLIDGGAQFKVPEKLLEDFNRADLWHIAVTADKDLFTGLYMLPAGTYGYDVCANEAMYQIRSLDLRGYPELAERYLEPFVKLQGSRPLHGKFGTQEGVLHGLRVAEGIDYQEFSYNLDHGFTLWMLCEHYRLTHNEEWLRKVASNIVAAGDFVTRERQATKKLNTSGEKVWEYGLLPPGHLEDNTEWLYWYAVNAYAYRGMKAAADVLAEIGHPDAERIGKEADEYGQDLLRVICMSMTLSPVVRLGDGTYVPHQPVRCRLRGRDLGWIRECAYGAIHLIECGLFKPWDQESTWILKDAENTAFLEPSIVISGRQINQEKWFSQGGTTLQPNLVPTTLVYLNRDQPEHAIRIFYNTFVQSIYSDVRAFAEWVPTFGVGGGPLYKTPDECAFIIWLRYLLLQEDGDKLMIAPATPRKWLEDGKEVEVTNAPTYFGKISYKIISKAGSDEIKAVIVPPKEDYLKELRVRFRHPQKKTIKKVTVNGKEHTGFDAQKEIIKIKNLQRTIEITAQY